MLVVDRQERNPMWTYLVSLNQSDDSPLTFLINKVFPAVELNAFCFSFHSAQTLETAVCENPLRAFSF